MKRRRWARAEVPLGEVVRVHRAQTQLGLAVGIERSASTSKPGCALSPGALQATMLRFLGRLAVTLKALESFELLSTQPGRNRTLE